MANFHRVVLCCVLVTFAGYSLAAVRPATVYYTAGWVAGGPSSYGLVALEQCQNLAGFRESAGGSYIDGVTVNGTSCIGGNGVHFGDIGVVYYCASPSTGPDEQHMCTTVTPVCVAPQVLNAAGDACVTDVNVCPKSGTSAGWWGGPGGAGAKEVCNTDERTGSGDSSKPGCTVKGNSTFATGDHPPGSGADSRGYQWGADMTFSGDKCAAGGGSGTGKHEEGPSCTPPKVQGTVNGVVTCYTPSTSTPTESQPAPKTTTTAGPDGTKTETQTGTKTDCVLGICTTVTTVTTTSTPPGGTAGVPVINTTTTTCVAGPGCSPVNLPPTTVVTTTTTPTPPGGSGGPATTTTTTTTAGSGGSSGGGGGSGKGNGNGDGPDSAFAGACGAPPACAGDAILCAVAAATFATNCVLQDPKVPTPLYDSAVAKTGDQTSELPGNSTVNVNSSQFDQTELLGAAGGMADRTIVVMGSNIVLPFSGVNVWLARLGVVLQAITFLLCARIVTRG